MKISILGAAGKIGQCVSLLLKCYLFNNEELLLYDIVPEILGLAMDLSHINTNVNVIGFYKNDLRLAIDKSDIILITAGLSRNSNMNRSDLFYLNADIIFNLIDTICKINPNSLIVIITNPINSIIPFSAEILKKNYVYNKNKLFGLTTLDVFRANFFLSSFIQKDIKHFNVKVIGGHSELTILPLFSQVSNLNISLNKIMFLTREIRESGRKVIASKFNKSSSTLSIAQAASKFCLSLIRGLNNEEGVIECSYVENEDIRFPKFFAQPVCLGKKGIKKRIKIGELSAFEKEELRNVIFNLEKDIKLGEFYFRSKIKTKV